MPITVRSNTALLPGRYKLADVIQYTPGPGYTDGGWVIRQPKVGALYDITGVPVVPGGPPFEDYNFIQVVFLGNGSSDGSIPPANFSGASLVIPTTATGGSFSIFGYEFGGSNGVNYGAAWVSLSFSVGFALFTEAADNVDFRNLTPAQLSAIAGGAQVEQAMGGDDRITLSTTYTTINAGQGNDTVTGSPADDRIEGGVGDDTVIGSAGKDDVRGGAGKDTFDYQTRGFSGFTSDTTQVLDGGTEGADSRDLLKLPGSANDYTVAVSFGRTWADTKTFVRSIDGSGLTKVTLSTSEIERAVFKEPIDSLLVTCAGESVTVEMALLANEVYGLLDGPHEKEELLSDKPGLQWLGDATTTAAQGRHWRGVSALELGILPGDFDDKLGQPAPYADLDWSFVGGHYAAYKPDFFGPLSLVTDEVPEANAIVLSGVVKGYGKSLAIVLRGTDQLADFGTFASFKSYYDLYRPLVDGLRTYVAENQGQIDSILIAGHSLGAGAMQYLLNESFLQGNDKVHAWSFGSPGSEVGGNTGQYNFVHTDDLVTKVPTVTDAFQLVGLAGLMTDNPYAIALGAIGSYADKSRTGSDVYINSDVSGLPWIPEHAQTLYVQDLIKLNEFAKDPDSPFHDSSLGIAIREGTTYKGGTIQVGVGRPKSLKPPPGQYDGPYASTIESSKFDNYVLASNEDDDIVVNSFNVIANANRIFDGGAGKQDLLILPYASSVFTREQVGAAWDLAFAPVNAPRQAVGSLYRVEGIFFRDRFEWFDGHKAKAQKPDTSSPVFQLQTGFDVADAGNGSLTVVGTAGKDSVLVGSGSKTVVLGEGRDIVMARSPNSIDALTIDGGGGDDLVYSAGGADFIEGGAGIDNLNGGAGNDRIDGGGGADTMAGEAGDDRYVVDDAADMVVEATGGGNDTIVTEVSYGLAPGQEIEWLKASAGSAGSRLDLSGNEFANSLTGNAGANVLIGGAGKDTLDGGSGVDTADYGDKTATVQVMLSGTATSDVRVGGVIEDRIRNVENVRGGSGGDRLVGDGLANGLFGMGGDDLLRGGAGNDVLDGGDGIDTASYADASAGVRVTLASVGRAQGTGGAGVDTLSGFENLTGSAFDDVLTGDANANVLLGGAGRDQLIGGGGIDTMDGGEDGDTYTIDVDIVHDTGTTGTDTAIANRTTTLTSDCGIEVLKGKIGSTGNLVLTGNELDNRIIGNDGDNLLRGLAGADTLYGGLGNDRLEGGVGRDTLAGEAGNDTFLFKTGDSTATATTFDSVLDFLTGADRIDLDTIGAGGLTPGAYVEASVASNAFGVAKTAAATAMAGGSVTTAFVAGTTIGWLFWSTDGNNATIEQAVRLSGANSLGAFDRTDLV